MQVEVMLTQGVPPGAPESRMRIRANSTTIGGSAYAEESDPFASFVEAVPGLQQDLDTVDTTSTVTTEAATNLLSVQPDASSEIVAESASGATVVENAGGVLSTTVPRGGDTVQALVSIPDRDAPTNVVFKVGGTPYLDENGDLKIRTDAGTIYSTLPAWARDADGTSVPSHYEVRDHDVVQVVDHTSGDYTYPIVADPFAFVTLFDHFSRTTDHGDYRYNGFVTVGGAIILSGGGGVGGYLAGQAVFRGAGWDEWKAHFGSAISNKATLNQQYNCHVAAGVYGLPFTQDYNLERYRANRTNWVDGIQSHHCNW